MPGITFSLAVSSGGRVRAFFRRDVDWPDVPRAGDRVETGWDAQPELAVERVSWQLEDGAAAVALAVAEASGPLDAVQQALEGAGWQMSPMPGTHTPVDDG
jgi:hypothetical protein